MVLRGFGRDRVCYGGWELVNGKRGRNIGQVGLAFLWWKMFLTNFSLTIHMRLFQTSPFVLSDIISEAIT